jgi:hypothetical protein
MSRSAIDSTALYINSVLNWHLGLLSVDVGAQLSRTEQLHSTNSVVLATQYYYLTLTRKLF